MVFMYICIMYIHDHDHDTYNVDDICDLPGPTTDVVRVSKSVVVVLVVQYSVLSTAQLFNAKVTPCQMYANPESLAWPGLVCVLSV